MRHFHICNSWIASVLASCGRLPLPFLIWPTGLDTSTVRFFTHIDSQLNDFLNEIHQIARLEPSIVERIDEDLDLHVSG